jgi:hypothetical protein
MPKLRRVGVKSSCSRRDGFGGLNLVLGVVLIFREMVTFLLLAGRGLVADATGMKDWGFIGSVCSPVSG